MSSQSLGEGKKPRGCHFLVACLLVGLSRADAKHIDFLQPNHRSSSPSPPSLIAIASQPIAPSSHAEMSLLGKKFPAQIGMSLQIA
jgi:hypothetical protein